MLYALESAYEEYGLLKRVHLLVANVELSARHAALRCQDLLSAYLRLEAYSLSASERFCVLRLKCFAMEVECESNSREVIALLHGNLVDIGAESMPANHVILFTSICQYIDALLTADHIEQVSAIVHNLLSRFPSVSSISAQHDQSIPDEVVYYVSLLLDRLAVVYYRQQSYRRAIAAAQSAYSLKTFLFGKARHVETTRALSMLCHFYRGAEQYKLAAVLLRSCISTQDPNDQSMEWVSVTRQWTYWAVLARTLDSETYRRRLKKQLKSNESVPALVAVALSKHSLELGDGRRALQWLWVSIEKYDLSSALEFSLQRSFGIDEFTKYFNICAIAEISCLLLSGGLLFLDDADEDSAESALCKGRRALNISCKLLHDAITTTHEFKSIRFDSSVACRERCMTMSLGVFTGSPQLLLEAVNSMIDHARRSAVDCFSTSALVSRMLSEYIVDMRNLAQLLNPYYGCSNISGRSNAAPSNSSTILLNIFREETERRRFADRSAESQADYFDSNDIQFEDPIVTKVFVYDQRLRRCETTLSTLLAVSCKNCGPGVTVDKTNAVVVNRESGEALLGIDFDDIAIISSGLVHVGPVTGSIFELSVPLSPRQLSDRLLSDVSAFADLTEFVEVGQIDVWLPGGRSEKVWTALFSQRDTIFDFRLQRANEQFNQQFFSVPDCGVFENM